MSLNRGLVWITGASSGIGFTSCVLFARNNWKVIASARSQEALNRLSQKYNNIIALPLDVSNPLQRKQVYNEILEKHGPVNVLVNNAGYGIRGAVEETRISDVRKLYDVNVFAPLELSKLVLPEMRQQREGRIIMVSSVVGKIAMPLSGVYASSKFALEGLSDALRVEVKPWDIKVSLVEPGPIATKFQSTAKDLSLNRIQDSNSPYASYYDLQFNLGGVKPHNFWGPSTVAYAILHAAEDSVPKNRYPVHPMAVYFPLLARFLPSRLIDYIIARKYGFDKPASWV